MNAVMHMYISICTYIRYIHIYIIYIYTYFIRVHDIYKYAVTCSIIHSMLRLDTSMHRIRRIQLDS